MKPIQTTLLMLCGAISAPTTFAHDIDDGLELGASLTLTSSSPVQATLTLIPKVDFKSVLVELPNVIGGPQTACRFGALVQNQRYTCNVSGSVANDDSGLVIALSGVRAASIPGHDDLVFKGFTVPNPKFNVAAKATAISTLKTRITLDSNRGSSSR